MILTPCVSMPTRDEPWRIHRCEQAHVTQKRARYVIDRSGSLASRVSRKKENKKKSKKE